MTRQRASPTTVKYGDARITRMLQALLGELAEPLMRVGITPRLFGELAAQAFVKAACQASTLRNGRINQSRVAVLTGLSRPEVRKLMRGPRAASSRYQPRTMRVIDGWLSDSRYTTQSGTPRALPLNGRLSFASLVRKYAGDVPHHAVLEELRHIQWVKEEPDGIQLIAPVASIPRSMERSLNLLLAIASDGVALCAPRLPSPAKGVHRITLNTRDARESIVMYERALSSALSFVSGLDQSLRTLPRRNARARGNHVTVSVLVRRQETYSKTRRHGNVEKD